MRETVRTAKNTIEFIVDESMTAILDKKQIHPVLSTFWICYYAEVASRKAIEDYFDEGENAVGAGLTIHHKAMCPIGATVSLTASVISFDGSKNICCEYHVTRITSSGNVLIAYGIQDQVVMKQSSIDELVQKAITKE